MKAIRISVAGGPDVLDYVDMPKPTPGEGQVLVRAHAIGVGKPDVLFRTGVYRWMPKLPAVPGSEMTGRIEALGPGVSGLSVGQNVLAVNYTGGCYAEFAAVPAAAVTALPDGADLDAAASIPNYQTSWALLHEATRGAPIRALYINGAAGGIGSAVIQLARHAGITAIAGASTAEKCAFARAQGAAHAIDYSRENPVERVLALTEGRGVDLVLDHIAGKGFTDNLKMLAVMGQIVSFNALGGMPEQDLFREMRAHLPKSPTVRCFTMHSYDHDPAGRRRIVSAVMALFAAGAVNPPIHARLPLAEARRAHQMLDAREVMGKLILNP
jgi:NADPH2:quinone reductase